MRFILHNKFDCLLDVSLPIATQIFPWKTRIEVLPKQFAKLTLGLNKSHCLLPVPHSILNKDWLHQQTSEHFQIVRCPMLVIDSKPITPHPIPSNSISFGKPLNVMNSNISLYHLARTKHQIFPNYNNINLNGLNENVFIELWCGCVIECIKFHCVYLGSTSFNADHILTDKLKKNNRMSSNVNSIISSHGTTDGKKCTRSVIICLSILI